MVKESDKFFLDFETIDFLKFFKSLKKNKLLIILFAGLVTSLTFYISYKKDYLYQGSITFKNHKFNIAGTGQNKTCTNISNEFIKNKFNDENSLLKFYDYYKSLINKNKLSFQEWKNTIEVTDKSVMKTLTFTVKSRDKKINKQMINFGKTFLLNKLSSEINNCIDKSNENMQKQIIKSKNEFYDMTEEISKYILDQKNLSEEEREQFNLFGQYFAQKTFGFQNVNRNILQGPYFNPTLNIVKLPTESLIKFIKYQDKLNFHIDVVNSFERDIKENLLLKTQSFDYLRIINTENILSKDIKSLFIQSIIKGITLSILFSIILFFWKDIKKSISKF